jgi:hypothetical protein
VAADRLPVGIERGANRTFAWVMDWPGWCRSGKGEELAFEALIAAAPRYAVVASTAGLKMKKLRGDPFEVVDDVAGGGGTDFGVPSVITDHDRRPTTSAEAARLTDLVAAAWTVLDDVAAHAPASLRKGPRGGGRDRDRMLGHVIDSDHAYAHEMGLTTRGGSLADRAAVDAERAAMLDLLRRTSDGSPLGGRRWTQRYAARRVAWHALDHAWEMEDRSEPA